MILAILCVLGIFLVFPGVIAGSAGSALDMCIESVIPSLFPFMVISRIIISSGRIKEDNLFFRFLAKIFNISTAGVWALCLGLVCGYPVGAKIVCDLKREKRISGFEAQKLMMFANNAGPAFCIVTVGGMFFSSVRAGAVIYLSHISASLLTGLVLSFFPVTEGVAKKNYNRPPFFRLLTESVSDGVMSVINVTGIIVFFSALLNIFDISGLTSVLPDGLSGVLKGVFEMTGGIKELSLSSLPLRIKVALSSFLVSFSGLSVFAQVLTFSEGIKITPCIICKVAGGLVAMLISFTFL